MARKRRGGRKYGKKAAQKVERAMRERKRGTLRSGRSGKKVTSREQAIAIGLAEARREGARSRRRSDERQAPARQRRQTDAFFAHVVFWYRLVNSVAVSASAPASPVDL